MVKKFVHHPRDTDSSTNKFAIRAFRFDDEIIVTADLPGVSIDELSVGFIYENKDLIIEVKNEYRARVPLPWDSVTHSQACFTNAVFEIRIRPAEENHR